LITAEHRKLKEEYTEKSAEGAMSLDAYGPEDVSENSIDALKKVYLNKQPNKIFLTFSRLTYRRWSIFPANRQLEYGEKCITKRSQN
jgi:hypothetical protein